MSIANWWRTVLQTTSLDINDRAAQKENKNYSQEDPGCNLAN
ncbi:MAG: hypothetical protein ACYDH2_03460 [Anaerolineaceae bacterium]